MPPCHGGGRRFEPVPGRHFFYKLFGFIAQLVEQRTENPRVSGSIPLEATNFFMVDVAQLVRAPVCGTGGREFESHLPPHLFSTIFLFYILDCSQAVRHQTLTLACASSNLASPASDESVRTFMNRDMNIILKRMVFFLSEKYHPGRVVF